MNKIISILMSVFMRKNKRSYLAYKEASQISKAVRTITKREQDHRNSCLQAYEVKVKAVKEGKGKNTVLGIPLAIEMEKGIFVSNPCFK